MEELWKKYIKDTASLENHMKTKRTHIPNRSPPPLQMLRTFRTGLHDSEQVL